MTNGISLSSMCKAGEDYQIKTGVSTDRFHIRKWLINEFIELLMMVSRCRQYRTMFYIAVTNLDPNY